MKANMRFSRIFLALALIWSWSPKASAALPEAGKVYQLVNVAYSTALTGNGPTSSPTCSESNASDMAQRWLVTKGASDNTFYLRCLNTGMYLRSSRGFSSPWSIITTPTKDADLSIVDEGSYTYLRCVDDIYQCMHCDSQGIIVSWTFDTEASHWTFKPIEMSQAEIEAALKAAEENSSVADDRDAIQAALDAIFSDKACTQLQSKYASMPTTQLTLDANYKMLPATLKQMVTKVKSGNWEETDEDTGKTWDTPHAKKFRVQSYEPFSRGDEAAQMVGIQAYTNMNNPTGIITKNRKTLYVMVDKAPADGSTLCINGAVGAGMYNDWSSGVELKEGLNIIPVWENDAAQFIYYTVNTYNSNTGQRQHKLTEFDDIKIHIEGGSLNGFFNAVGDELYTPDTNEDWFYYRERATHTMFDLVGKYVILHFFLDPVFTKAEGGKLVNGLRGLLQPGIDFDLPTIMTAWDDFCFAERLLLGIQSNEDIQSARAKGYFDPLTDSDVAPNDFHLYFNNRMMGITMQGDLFMNATSWRTAYNPSTMHDILLELPKSSGALWGPAHEYGHMNQEPMKFAGTTEISNNIFSNVAIFYQGITTSRADYPSEQRRVFNNQQTYLENGTWGTTRMFWQLWLYYHVQGHNRKFYPTLYELLRQNPRKQSYYLNPRHDMLHFAKMCCMAAGEDLTDFFDAWGFFIPLKDYMIDDYSQFVANLTQADIDDVKAEIAALNLPKSRAIIFIDDRPGSDRKTHDEFSKTLCGALGGLKDFAADTKPSGNYIFTLGGTTVTVSGGTGGVGFLALDNNNGKLITFSNDLKWEIRGDAAAKIATGDATLYAVAANGDLTEVPNAINAGSADQKTQVINAMLSAAKKMLNMSDKTLTKVGWYRATRLANLSKIYDEAKEIASTDPAKAYGMLANEYYSILLNPYSRISARAGNSYRIDNRRYTGKSLTAGLNNALSRATDNNSEIQQWLLEDAGDGMFYLYNKKQGKYIQSIVRSTAVAMDADSKQKIALIETEPGYYALAADGSSSYCLHIDQQDKVVGWDSSEEPSQWQIVLSEADELNEAKERLEELVNETGALLDKAGSINITNAPIKLKASNMSSNARCRETSYGDQFRNWNVLFDGVTSTYFHSDYSSYGSTDGLDHYLQVDLGEGNGVDNFTFTYTTRANGSIHAPSAITVFVSNDAENWETAATFANGLPSSALSVFISSPIITSEPYRHLRFMVTATYEGDLAEGHPYFVMSEFGVSKSEVNANISERYPKVTESLMIDAYIAKLDAESVLGSDATEAEVFEDAYNTLEPYYLQLLAATDLTSIETIVGDNTDLDNGKAMIFDLSGRRVNNVTTPGLYIINGHKVMVR